MNELVQISAPDWANILLLTLTFIIGLSMISYFIAFIMRSAKLGEFSIYSGIISFISFMVFTVVGVCIIGYTMANPNAYTITKTDDTILVNSKSDWIANSTYNILEHKNGIYYLYDPEHPKKLVKISDDELGKMIAKE
jgi:hypothetical protein